MVIDDSGNGLDATVHDNPKVDSPNGMALKLMETKKLSVVYADALNLPSYTVSIWMNRKGFLLPTLVCLAELVNKCFGFTTGKLIHGGFIIATGMGVTITTDPPMPGHLLMVNGFW